MTIDEEPMSMLHSFSEAMKSLDDVKLFLESWGCIQESITVGSTMDHSAIAHLHCIRQTTLLTLFPSAEKLCKTQSGSVPHRVLCCGISDSALFFFNCYKRCYKVQCEDLEL